MNDPLPTYLHDHLAGAAFAVEVLESLRDHHADEEIGRLARTLLVEVEDDRQILKVLTERLSAGSNVLKETVSWLAEKASRLKLRRTSDTALGTFESIEALTLGILGKEALWMSLDIAAEKDARLRDWNFKALAESARDQHARIEEQRRALARQLFTRVS